MLVLETEKEVKEKDNSRRKQGREKRAMSRAGAEWGASAFGELH